MFTAIKNWLDNLSPRSDVGLARVQSRTMARIQQVIKNVETANTELDHAYSAGVHEGIVHAYVKYRKAYELEINKLLRAFLYSTTLLDRHMDEFTRLSKDGVTTNMTSLSGPAVLKNYKAAVEAVAAQTKHLIGAISSFDNTTYSAQRLIDIASQAREAQNEFRKAVIDEKKLKRVESMLDKDARAGKLQKRDEAAMQTLLESIKTDMDEEAKGVGIILIMLQEIIAELGKQERKIVEEYQVRDKYPETWAKADLQVVKDLEQEIHAWIAQEIPKLRLFASKAERITA